MVGNVEEWVEFVDEDPKKKKELKRAAKKALNTKERAEKMEASRLAEKEHADHKETMLKQHFAAVRKEELKNLQKELKNATQVFEFAKAHIEEGNDAGERKENLIRRELCKCAKLFIQKVEPQNHCWVFAFRSATGANWWKMGGNSVVAYQMLVASSAARIIKVVPDSDNFYKFANGVTCIKTSEAIERDVLATNAPLTRDNSLDFGIFRDYIVAFRLNVPLQDHELRIFQKKELEQRKKISDLIFSAAPDPAIHERMMDVVMCCAAVTKGMDNFSRILIDNGFMKTAQKLVRSYDDIANNARRSVERKEAFETMDSVIGDLVAEISICSELLLVDHQRISKISFAVAALRSEVRGHISRFAKSGDIKSRIQNNEAVEVDLEEETE